MSEPINDAEAAALRALLAKAAPRTFRPETVPPLNPDSWEGRLGAEHERQRFQRIEAARVAHETAQTEEAAQQARKQARLAVIKQEIAELEAKRAPLLVAYKSDLEPFAAAYWRAAKPVEDKHKRHIAPLDDQLAELRREQKELE